MSENTEATRRGVVAMAASGLALALAMTARTSRAAPPGDLDALNALLQAELNGIATYDAGGGVLAKIDAAAPNAAIAPTVLAVALHFQAQHKDHAKALRAMITSLGGTPLTHGEAQIPTGFKPSVLNVVRLAANAEKAAAIAYTEALKGMTTGTAAALAASIGGVETQHFAVLHALAHGLVQGTMTTKDNAADLVPAAFVIAGDTGDKSLEGVAAFTYA